MVWDNLSWPEMTWHGLRWLEITWDGMTLDDLTCTTLRWPEMTWHGLTWDYWRWRWVEGPRRGSEVPRRGFEGPGPGSAGSGRGSEGPEPESDVQFTNWSKTDGYLAFLGMNGLAAAENWTKTTGFLFLFMSFFSEARTVERQQIDSQVAILIIALDLWRLYWDIKPGTVFFVLFSG